MPWSLERHVPGHPLHLIQRGWCRADCFFTERDRLAYLHWLARIGGRTGCALHAYVLMKNHVHLLVTPSRADSAALLMRLLAERYQRHAEETLGFETAVWEKRYEAWPVYPRRYLLACMRYIELNPVRAGLVELPGQHRWSSYRANALGQEDARITPHVFYYALGRTAAARQAAYRAMFRSGPLLLREQVRKYAAVRLPEPISFL